MQFFEGVVHFQKLFYSPECLIQERKNCGIFFIHEVVGGTAVDPAVFCISQERFFILEQSVSFGIQFQLFYLVDLEILRWKPENKVEGSIVHKSKRPSGAVYDRGEIV